MNRERNWKLIRDKYPDIFLRKWENVQTRILDESEKFPALLDKLLEESQEVKDSGWDLEEIADVLEVLMEIIKEKWMNIADIEQVRLRKLNEKGWFKKWTFLED